MLGGCGEGLLLIGYGALVVGVGIDVGYGTTVAPLVPAMGYGVGGTPLPAGMYEDPLLIG